jgi:hypothetical protein
MSWIKARAILKSAGVPIVRHENKFSDASLFEIAAEGGMPLNSSGPWYYADYYEMFWGSPDLNSLLDDNELRYEWINPGIMGVYHA